MVYYETLQFMTFIWMFLHLTTDRAALQIIVISKSHKLNYAMRHYYRFQNKKL